MVFPGGDDTLSDKKNPKITYSTPGVYDVTLIVENAYGTDTLTIPNYITVTNGVSLPLTEDFETLPFPGGGWTVFNPDGDAEWDRFVGASGYGAGVASTRIDNYSTDLSGTDDEFRSPQMDFSAAGTYWLEFDVAYARYDSDFKDSLYIAYSTDCGDSWTEFKRYSVSEIRSAPNTTSLFVPTSGQWRSKMVNLSALAGNTSLSIAFGNIGGYGNPVYLDNINIYKGDSAVADFTASDTSICMGDTVRFSNTSTADSLNGFLWLFPGERQILLQRLIRPWSMIPMVYSMLP